MRISVVVPTYNRASLIGETLDAIRAQTCQPHEIIVVDDGSTDDTQAVMGGRADARTIRIPNSGELVARNTGLHAAEGELVAFCDSDDLWRADHLATMAALWAKAPQLRYAYANFSVVQGGVWQAADKFAAAPPGFWDGLRPVDDGAGEDAGIFETPITARLLTFQPFFPSTLVVDRAFFTAIGGWDEGVSRLVGCDFATTLRLSEHEPSGVVRRVTVGIRKHADNFSADVQKMNLGDSMVLAHVLATRPSLAPHAEAIRASILARRCAAFETAFARGDLDGARQIAALLPAGAGPGGKIAIKRLATRMPPPIDRWLNRLLAGAGTGLSRTLATQAGAAQPR